MKRFFVSLIVIIPIFAYSEAGTLRIASLEYPPFIFEENNEAKGSIVEIAAASFRTWRSTDIALLPPVETVNSYLAFGRMKDFSLLSSRFDETISKMQAEGTIPKINKKGNE